MRRNLFRGLYVLIFLVFLSGAGFVVINYYQYIFARTVQGTVIGIERVTDNLAIIGGRPIPAEQMFSFAIAIKQDNGEVITASSEDRRWAVVQKGNWVKATLYPYPPWQLGKGGSYHGARVDYLKESPDQ